MRFVSVLHENGTVSHRYVSNCCRVSDRDGPVHTKGLDRPQIDLAFIRIECERSHFFEIDLGSIQPGSLQEVV